MAMVLEASGGRATEIHPRVGTLAALSLAMLLPSLSTSIANIALPTLTQAFEASFGQVQWVVLAYLLALTTVIVSVGRLGDIVGRKRLLLAGILLFTAGAGLSGLAPALWLLIAARAIQGVGAAVMMTLSIALVHESVPPEKAGSALGLLGTMSAVGTALGPSLGGLLIAAAGWRSIFLIAVPLGAVAFVLGRRLPESSATPGRDRPGFDKLGTLLLATALGAFSVATTFGGGSFGSLNIALLIGAVAALALFLLSQARSPTPLIPLETMRRPAIRTGLVAGVLVSTVLMTTMVVGPFYLSGALGLQSAIVGLVMSIGPAVVALCGVPAGRAADRFGSGRTTIIGLIGILTGCLLLSLLPANLSLLGYIPAAAVLTLGYALFQTSNNLAVMAGATPDQRGVVSGMLNLSRNLGLICGASVMGAVFANATTAHSGGVPAHAVAVAMHVTFAVAACLVLMALTLTCGSTIRSGGTAGEVAA
jgi:EmrB/QacA subfamily drug resistance transporter